MKQYVSFLQAGNINASFEVTQLMKVRRGRAESPASDTWTPAGSNKEEEEKKKEKFWSFSLVAAASSSFSFCVCPRWIGFSDLRKCTAEIQKEAHLSAPE